MWIGKLLGFIAGLYFGPFGVLGGLILGHLFDNGLKNTIAPDRHSENARITFFATTFLVMGHLAKSDGQVTTQELAFAKKIMENTFKLDQNGVAAAIDFFRQGKAQDFNLEHALNNFMQDCGEYGDLRVYFLEIQVQAASVSRTISLAEESILQTICTILNIPGKDLEYLLRLSNAQRTFQANFHSGRDARFSKSEVVIAAYELLGVRPEDDDKTIKKAYRTLISRHHPDKLVAKGLPKEMMLFAKEKTQEITVAYETIKQSRKQ